jgi:hypothetical protein
VQAQRGLWAVDIAPWSVSLDEPAPKKEGDAEPKTDAEPKQDAKTDAKADAKTDARADAKPDAKGDGKRGAKDDDKSGPSDDAKRLRWIDAKAEAARFVPWHAFQHPELGAVEIGGFAPYALVEPPDADREEIAKKDVEFLIELGGDLARLKLIDVAAKDLGDGLWDLKATLVNDGYFPYPSALGLRTRAIRPARVTLEPKEVQLLGGERQILVRELAGSGGRKELHWLVRGVPPSGMRIAVDTDFAGALSAVPEVK